MRTTKPISTISFNTKVYLQGKLEELIKARKISAYHFIEHLAEEDEKKNHIHLWLLPTKMIQTEDLRDELKELDPANPSKPLGCLPFESSDFDNWYLYVLHDERYLTQKGQSRKYHYKRADIVSSDDDYLDEQVRKIDLLHLSPYQDMLDAVESGLSWEEYFARGTVPIPQITNFKNAYLYILRYKSFKSAETYRGQYQGHSDDAYPSENIVLDPNTNKLVDPITGEIIE